jgi:hypothetical protein
MKQEQGHGLARRLVGRRQRIRYLPTGFMRAEKCRKNGAWCTTS